MKQKLNLPDFLSVNTEEEPKPKKKTKKDNLNFLTG